MAEAAAFEPGPRLTFQFTATQVWAWARKLAVPPSAGETWDGWVTRILDVFWAHCRTMDLTFEEAAMYFRVHRVTLRGEPGWDKDYAASVLDAIKPRG